MSDTDCKLTKACVDVEHPDSASDTTLVPDVGVDSLGSRPVLKEDEENKEEITAVIPRVVQANDSKPVNSAKIAATPDHELETGAPLSEETSPNNPKTKELNPSPVITTESESEAVTDQEPEKECPLPLLKTEIEDSKNSEIEPNEEKSTSELQEESTVVISIDGKQSSSTSVGSDLVNATSDNAEKEIQGQDEEKLDFEEDDDTENDQVEPESDKGTCSRSRPYVRPPNKPNLNEVSSTIAASNSSKVMPTPPEEADEETDDDHEISKNKKLRLTPGTPPVINLTVKGEKVVNPLESSKTEQYAFSGLSKSSSVTSSPGISTYSNKTDSQLTTTTTPHFARSRDPSGESVNVNCSSRSDSSTDLVVGDQGINPVPAKTSPSHNFYSVSSDVADKPNALSTSSHLQSSSHPDHKDKRLLGLSSPGGGIKSGSGQYHSHHQHPNQHGLTTAAITSASCKKGSKIPIGIAVAWQRLVTSNSSLPNSSSLVNTTSSQNKIVVAEMPKLHKEKAAATNKPPIRPSSASPSHHVNLTHHSQERNSSGHKIREESSTKRAASYSVKRGSCGSISGDVGGPSVIKRPYLETSGKSATPELMASVGETSSCRPLPSSSVPPNLGLSYNFHPQQLSSAASPSLLEYHYSNMRSLTPFPHQTSSHSHFHTLPPTWQAASASGTNHHLIGLGLGSDLNLNVPQGYPSAGAYIQQSMQNQLQFQQHLAQQYLSYSSGGSSSISSHQPHYLSSSAASGGYESTLRHHYEALIQQQQQSEYLRHFHHQQNHLGHQLLAGMYNTINDGLRTTPTTFPPTTNTRLPLLSPSPSGGVRTPTPNSGFSNSSPASAHGLSLSNLSVISPAGQSSTGMTAVSAAGYSGNWPAELFIHQHTSAALSPKSLTSSSPSPVTVQQLHPHPEHGIVNTIAGSSGVGNTTITFVSGRKCATPSPKLRKSFPLKDVWEDKTGAAETASLTLTKAQVKKKHLSPSLDEKSEEDPHGENSQKRKNRHLNLHPSPVSSHGLGSESKTPFFNHKPDTEKILPGHGSEVRGDERQVRHQHVFEVSYPSPPQLHTTTKLHEPIHSKHDFKRLDSLIEKRNSSTETEKTDSVSVTGEDGEAALDLIVTSNVMKSHPNKSVIMLKEEEKVGEAEDNVVKVYTDLSTSVASSKIMDLKHATFTSPTSIPEAKEKCETDLNQNLKLVSLPPQPTIHNPPVTKPSSTKKAANCKTVKVDEKTTCNKKKKKPETPKKPRKTTKEKSLLSQNDSPVKEKATPKSKKIKDPNEQPPVKRLTVAVKATKRKSCKIKPDINVDNNKNATNNSSCNGGEPLELVKHPKPKVYKSNKTKEQEENKRRILSSTTTFSSSSSCDPLLLDVPGTSKGNGNIVPELNLPVATSKKVITLSKNDSLNSLNRDKYKSKEFGTKIGLSLISPVSVDSEAVCGKVNKSRKKRIPSTPKKVIASKKLSSQSVARSKRDPKPDKVKKVLVKKEQRKKPVAIKSKGTEPRFTTASSSPSSIAANTTVILSGPNNPSIAFATSSSANKIAGNPMVTISSPTSGCNPGENSLIQSSPNVIPLSLPYQNSPVTLILPRILPQPPTISNTQQHTSFKLVVSSQEIKIPAFIPSQSGSFQTTFEGSSQTFQLHHHHHEQVQSFPQNMTNASLSLHQNVQSATSSSTCDTVSLVGGSIGRGINGDNTITFIRDSPMSIPTQNGHFIEGLTVQPNVQPPSSCYLSPPVTTTIQTVNFRKDVNQSEDNHLNLLATVAQEFGSRGDLGKLAHSNSSRGSSLMTSPILSVQSPELNFLTPSSTVSSCASNSISLPSSPLNITKFNCKSPQRDEYEYDEKESGGCGPTSSPGPGSYKHSVWLKIPTVMPTTGNRTGAPKRKRKPQEKVKQAPTEKTVGDKLPMKKQRINKKSESSANQNTQQKMEPKSAKANRSNLSPKLKIPKPKKEISPIKKKTHGGVEESLKVKTMIKPENLHSHPMSIKMTLPVPKIEKIRIKLSDSANPSLMEDKSSSSLSNNKKLLNGDFGQQTITKRCSEGSDKLSKLGKKKQASYTTSVNQNKPSEYPPKSTKKSYDGQNKKSSSKPYNHSLSPSPEWKTKDINTTIPVNTTTLLSPGVSYSIKDGKPPSSASIGDLFLSSFSSLTPPPTAKSVGGSGPNLLSTHLRTGAIFSQSNFESDQNQQQTKTQNNGESGLSKNWVSDPTFAASAARTLTSSSTDGHESKNAIKTEKDVSQPPLPFGGMSSDEDEDQALMEYERRTAERMRNVGASGILFGSGQQQNNNYTLKGFVPYHKRPTHRTLQQQQHSIKIKPCLKAEPRPRSSEEEHENSDEEIDYEVASLTNSIPRSHPSMLQQYRNARRKVSEVNSNGGEPKPTQITITTDNSSNHTFEHGKKRLTSTGGGTNQRDASSNKKHKHVVGRRLSLNLETGRTRAVDDSDNSEEELLDIGGDYSTSNSHRSSRHNSTGSHHNRHRRQSAAKNDKHQQIRNDMSFNKHRRFSGGSASTSASLGSTLPKRLPKKRGTRSLTTSSRSSVSSVVFGGSLGVGVLRSSRSIGRRESTTTASSSNTGPVVTDVHMEETLLPGKIELDSVNELKDEMRILTEIQGLFYTGKLMALQPPDVYGVTLDNERGAPPHLIFSAEEVLEKCVREKKPRTLSVRLRICAYWSPQYSGLYSGRVSTDFNPSGFDPEKDLIPIEFDDGDTGMIKNSEIRLLPANHPTREYDPNPLLTLEKKHRKRRHSLANTSSGLCTGDHDEPDCGESYCAKVAKMDDEEAAENGEDDDDEEEERGKASHHKYGKSLYWTWTGLGYKRSKAKKSRNKEFFRGIQRGDEIINVGDSAIFISHGNERPYIGRIEKFWEKKGQKIVNVRWFYHPEEVKSPKRIPHLKHTGALFESPHIDENDCRTIAKKCEVVPYTDFKERIGRLPMPKLSIKNSNSSAKPKDLYYVAGFYDPYTYNLQVKI